MGPTQPATGWGEATGGDRAVLVVVVDDTRAGSVPGALLVRLGGAPAAVVAAEAAPLAPMFLGSVMAGRMTVGYPAWGGSNGEQRGRRERETKQAVSKASPSLYKS